jgi:hypothetical protein
MGILQLGGHSKVGKLADTVVVDKYVPCLYIPVYLFIIMKINQSPEGVL